VIIGELKQPVMVSEVVLILVFGFYGSVGDMAPVTDVYF
jgi:hypothetical protein